MATQNFSAEVVRTIGGMGGVPPMVTLAAAHIVLLRVARLSFTRSLSGAP